mgnify:CR=1 FL=1
MTVLVPVFSIHILKHPLFAVSAGGLLTTLPRLGSRVRVSFLAQRKAFQFGRLFLSSTATAAQASRQTLHYHACTNHYQTRHHDRGILRKRCAENGRELCKTCQRRLLQRTEISPGPARFCSPRWMSRWNR